MKATATVILTCSDADARKSLASVLAPDNEGAPRGLKISMGGKGRRMEFRAEADSPSTAVSTVLALLRDTALFQEVWLLSRGKDARVHRA